MFRLLLNNARATVPRRSFARMYSARAGSSTNNSRLYWGVGLSVVPAYIAFTQLEAVKNDAEVAASDSVKLASAEVETKEAAPETASEQDHSGAAYNPVTGEINWDCPCLGGMAHGPCGEEFKEAFACFVYSESEPKGIDCITKFEVMRNCFREHPEHYKEELYDDEAASKAENEAAEAERATEEQADESVKAEKTAETEKAAETAAEKTETAETEVTKPAKAKKASSKPAEASASASA